VEVSLNFHCNENSVPSIKDFFTYCHMIEAYSYTAFIIKNPSSESQITKSFNMFIYECGQSLVMM